MNSINVPDKAYLNLIQNTKFKPIFIMADHRSGTTLLYQTLVATKCFNFIKAYHVIKYDEVLFNYINKTEEQSHQDLAKALTLLGIENRIIDNVTVTPNLPEEYGFILQNFGDESYINTKNINLFVELCQKIQFISDSHKQLLLKNPWCYQHFVYVKKAFPEAKFIFIHRNPIHVINSKLKAVRSILSMKNEYTALISNRYRKISNNRLQKLFYQLLYSSFLDLGINLVTKEAVESTTYFLQNIDALPKKDWVSVTYEDLCSEPKATIFKILEFLELEPRINLAYGELIQPRQSKFLPEVERKYNDIRQKLKPYFNYHGYDA